MDPRGEGPDRRGDVPAGHERVAGGPPARHRRGPALHLATVDGARRVDRGRCRRGGGARVRVPGVAGAGERVAAPAGQEDHGSRDPPRGRVPGRRPKETAVALDLVAQGRPVTAVADAIGISRQHLSAMHNRPPPRRRGRPPLPDAELVADIKMLVADLPTYGYRRVHALLRRQARQTGRAAPNPKRVYRVMKVHGLLLQPHSGKGEERRHDGRIAVDRRNTRWCSDALEIGCDNGEKVRVAFALDCCDREAMGHVATTGGITAEDVRDLMVATVEHRFGPVNRLAEPIEWLTDNGSPYVAGDTRRFARDIGLLPRTTPVSSPQSNGMAEAFVRTLKRDYVRVNPTPDARAVINQLPAWLAHYNEIHPHKALGYRSPREYITQTREARQALRGNDTD